MNTVHLTPMVNPAGNIDNDARLYELLKSSQEMRLKYIYFLLAATGACIGFSMTQTKTAPLTSFIAFWGAAQLCWALSFYLGCKALSGFSNSTFANSVVVRNAPISSNIAQTAKQKKEEAQRWTKLFEKTIVGALAAHKWQLWLFLVGSLFFIIWHIVEMWRRTPENMCLWV